MTEVWAAIDLYKGRIITPLRGKPEHAMVWSEEPLEVAKRWEREGASGLHIVDLDAAFETGSNGPIVESIIRRAKVPVQLGGGLRGIEGVQRWFKVGVDRVVIGTLAFQDPSALSQLLRVFGPERIVVAADYRGRTVVTGGWEKNENLTVIEAVKRLEAMHVKTVLATAVELDGTGKGPDITILSEIRKSTKMHILTSGGVRTLGDIKELQCIGVEGVVVGRALYEGTLRLTELGFRKD